MRLKTATILIAILYLIYQGGKWGEEFYRIKMGESCSNNLRQIETAKSKFRMEHPDGSVPTYADLKQYLPGVGIPTCPWGGEYTHVLNLDKETECSLNGNPNYEPHTPGVNLKENGFMDLSPRAKTVSYVDHVSEQLHDTYYEWRGENKSKKTEESLFGTPSN